SRLTGGSGSAAIGLGSSAHGRFALRRRLELGADVIALLVVGVLAVELAILGGNLATLGGLLDRQRDPPAVEIDVDDLDPELLSGGDHLLGRLDVLLGHLRDVDQTLDPFADLYERTERQA